MRNVCKFIALSMVATACAHGPVHMDAGGDLDAEPDLQWPVMGAVLTQKFRPHESKHHSRKHKGVDLAAPKNTPIYAADHGRVIYAGTGYTGYGKLIILQHANSAYRTYYAHLNRFKVGYGSIVKKGQMIGLMGNTGRSTGVHLHFEVRKEKVAVNPLDYLAPTAGPSQTASPQP